MKKLISSILSIVMVFTICFVPSSSVEDYGYPRFYLSLAEGYSEGDSSFAVELHLNDESVYGISYFGLTMDYTLNAALKESVSHYSGVYFSESVVEIPYSILGVAMAEDYFLFPFEDTVLATFYFDIIDVGYDGPLEISLKLDSENGVGDGNGDSLDDEVIVEGLTMDIVIPDYGSDDYPEEEAPDFDDLNYTGSDDIYVNENFMTNESFAKEFLPGAFYIEDGLMCGWDEARALQTAYTQVLHGGNYVFDNNSPCVWLTCDMSITMSLSDDETNAGDRWINLCYCNDNMAYAGTGSDRQFITFSYDFQNKCFRLTDGWNNTSAGGQFMTPVYKDISVDGSEFMNFGMSVEKDRLRFFYNGELIFDYTKSNFKIAHYVGTPFLLWNNGNIVKAKNITVAKQGYLFPEEGVPASEKGYVVGSDGFLVSYYGGDTAVLPDTVSRIGRFSLLKDKELKSLIINGDSTEIENGALFGLDNLTLRCYLGSVAEADAERQNANYRLIIPGDADDSGMVNTLDVTSVSRYFVGGDVELEYGADVNRDGYVDVIDLAILRRILV